MFRAKICGITSPLDAVTAARAGADAIGLNFYRPSPRFVGPDRAAEIVRAVPSGVVKVGVFVNASAQQVRDAFDRLRLDLVQLHGDEPPELLAELEGRPVMRAFRVGPAGLDPAMAYLAECRRLECVPRMVLVDAEVKGVYGGTGQVADWKALKQYPADGTMPAEPVEVKWELAADPDFTTIVAEGIDTGTDAGLRHVAERAGLSWADARPHLDGTGWRDEVEANRLALLEHGLWGVPSFRLVGDRHARPGDAATAGAAWAGGEADFCTWGQDRIWLVEAEIRRRLELYAHHGEPREEMRA